MTFALGRRGGMPRRPFRYGAVIAENVKMRTGNFIQLLEICPYMWYTVRD